MSAAAAMPAASAPAPQATRWTLVVRSRGQTAEARAALADLCEAYYGVVESFVRWQAQDHEAARDLTQEFFARVLAGSGLGGADPSRGKFRSYLLGAVKHFLTVETTRARTLKRGAGVEHVPLDTPADETHPGHEIPDTSALPPDDFFDRAWAENIVARALARLQEQMSKDGKVALFQTLRPFLQGHEPPPPQAVLAAQLNLQETALKVAIHRLRKRFRAEIKREIAETLDDPAMVDLEMKHLVTALSTAPRRGTTPLH